MHLVSYIPLKKPFQRESTNKYKLTIYQKLVQTNVYVLFVSNINLLSHRFLPEIGHSWVAWHSEEIIHIVLRRTYKVKIDVKFGGSS